jgi:hypothetical protein
MGTTLTGTTPQDTYDSLIKVTDNGPIGATAKYLSDGLGNDSKLSLSTSGVGINTTSVNQELEIAQALDPTIRLTSTQTSSGASGSSTGRIEFYGSSAAGDGAGIKAAIDTAATSSTRRDFDLIFKTGSNIGGGEPSEAIRITGSGTLGLGTSEPRSKLDVATSATEALFIGNTSTSIVAGDLLGAVSFGSRDSSTYSSGGITNIRSYATTDYNTGNVSGDIRFYTSNSLQNTAGAALFGSEAMRIDASGNVGIGTNAPNTQLEVSIAASVGGVLRLNNARTTLFDGDVNGSIQFSNNEATAGASGVRSEITSLVRDVSGKTDVVFTTAGSGVAATEKLRILADGGITFNGDTAAANALDDYEEGTWSIGVSFGGGSTGITYGHQAGTYTKIGRQVTVNGLMALTNKGSDTGDVRITGLPFTVPNSVSNYSAPSFQLFNISFANQVFGYGVIGTTSISMYEMTEAGAATTLTNSDFVNNSEIIISFTYFV